ncbi:GLPGLI family protein [Flavobacterium noncentrifugens]|uniref:GLPGLI family protein n=1 Tax=Flavobacterium noncentrifugens TaxID=1128970 RepID=A0A1G9B0U1_9FLAO|nr:GLPGLI family protein [Flavobacterium noncentrifugens]GEP51662.1 GLPGLI family protein [Flavobacterium noncentrifugens]SDK33162.1 GLPGLI family protein [Flavobacterium noncentrifugens]
MKKFTLSFLLIIVGFINAQAQDFQGMAVYESKTSTSDLKSRFEGNKDITPEMRKMIEDRMKGMFEKTFILNFDKITSTYKEEEKLDAPGQQQSQFGGGVKMMASMMGGGGTFYKNIKDKNYVVDKEFMGKEFLVKDSLPKLNWKMESETRQIGGYNCFKATAVRPVSKSDLRNIKFKNDKKDAAKTESKEKTTSIMEELEMPENITITAWYTPEIPVSQGPENYWGLPGLILEANDGKTTILCSKIVLNPKDKAVIKAPTNGKVISQKEYDETVVKKMEEIRKMNSGRNGNGMPMRMP